MYCDEMKFKWGIWSNEDHVNCIASCLILLFPDNNIDAKYLSLTQPVDLFQLCFVLIPFIFLRSIQQEMSLKKTNGVRLKEGENITQG